MSTNENDRNDDENGDNHTMDNSWLQRPFGIYAKWARNVHIKRFTILGRLFMEIMKHHITLHGTYDETNLVVITWILKFSLLCVLLIKLIVHDYISLHSKHNNFMTLQAYRCIGRLRLDRKILLLNGNYFRWASFLIFTSKRNVIQLISVSREQGYEVA